MSTTTATTKLSAIDFDRQDEALSLVKAGECSVEEFMEWSKGRDAFLRAQALTRSAGKLTCRVSAKGAVSIYGLGRWPVTLYREQWARLFQSRDAVELFIRANSAVLKSKADAAAAPAEIG